MGGFLCVERRDDMSEKQTQAIEKLAENMKNWSGEQKGYLLGYIEGVTQANKQEEKKEQ